MTSSLAVPEAFAGHLAEVTEALGDRPIDADLEAWLDNSYGPTSTWFAAAFDQCRQGVAEGWLCPREYNGVKFGRVIEPGGATHRFSVDVVEMNDVVGPYHKHPNGEVDLVMPLDATARFDGKGAGWKVYGPGSGHRPTVTGGKALVLYLLPEGEIDFIR